MKKLIIFLLSIFAVLFCTACNNTESSINFTDYENGREIYNITSVKLPYNLDKKCSSYSFDYDVDGVSVEGYISIPNDCDENNPYKCILYNRGGNVNMGHLQDTDTARICAETDRIVIASQYRKNDEFGGEDLNDVLKLIDLCEGFGFTDMTDFTVAGVSRGGMMSYMTARADSRIKRIISISGVSDLSSAYYDRDDMKRLLNNFIGGNPEDFPDEYEKRSATCWADEITIPVLIIHSTGDQQVNYSQAEEMYNALLKNGADVTMKTYNDSTHGLHKDDIKVISQWLSEN